MNDSLPDDAAAFDPNEFENTAFDFGGAYAGDDPVDDSASVASASTSERPGSLETPQAPAVTEPSDTFPAPTVSTADILKFLIDRTGYIQQLEEEDTPEAYSRIENLRELVNAAMDSRDRAETLDQFLDHAALVSDADDYDARAQITLMSLHAAKGLEFPLVFLSGLEEGLFPHSRTMLQPDDVEEERRLCYVGMTRAMDQLILTRAVYRRRYGTDLPEASVPSRFLEEVPASLIEEMGTSRSRVGTGARVGTGTPFDKLRAGFARPAGRSPAANDAGDDHYSYEDEDQSASWQQTRGDSRPRLSGGATPRSSSQPLPARSATRNTVKGRSINAKEKAKKPRLLYNFHASA